MFNCSASECSSATDFCFSSAISTDETPDKRALPDDRRAVGRKDGLDDARATYEWAPENGAGGARTVTGSFLPTQEALQLRWHREGSQEGAGALHNVPAPTI